jgi:hypothetical protein
MTEPGQMTEPPPSPADCAVYGLLVTEQGKLEASNQP